MKKLFLSGTVIFILFLAACGDDEPTGPLPQVAFEQDKNFVIVGETVTFTNNTVDGVSFDLDFGDGNGSSNFENTVTYDYGQTGEFTVTLTATGPGGRTNTATSTIFVGQREMTGFEIVSIARADQNGTLWDLDGTGPDIIFAFGIPNLGSFAAISVMNDVEGDDFPLIFELVNPDPPIEFTDTNWDFLLVDNELPFDDFNTNVLMISFTANPTTAGTVNSQNGSGDFTFTDTNGDFELIVRFQIQ